MRHRLEPRGGSRNDFQDLLEELEPEQEDSMARRFLTAEALSRFPEACAALVKNSMDVGLTEADAKESLNDLVFWEDSKGRLHCDDRIHPAFDDMWEGGQWVGSDEPEEEEDEW
jgi:hypothetical protein